MSVGVVCESVRASLVGKVEVWESPGKLWERAGFAVAPLSNGWAWCRSGSSCSSHGIGFLDEREPTHEGAIRRAVDHLREGVSRRLSEAVRHEEASRVTECRRVLSWLAGIEGEVLPDQPTLFAEEVARAA